MVERAEVAEGKFLLADHGLKVDGCLPRGLPGVREELVELLEACGFDHPIKLASDNYYLFIKIVLHNESLFSS